ncbi:carbohydrate sulfotransferase 10-like isoform X2 [Choloepus didactylus]|nr:carbohydrate sulfotransferase 10-like isoform X2 [Choloepus didactylus]XP_037663629.1 carbohydrate sulfotransferase 10-like isoform X2 [Choloepus didactylus]
MRGVHHQGSAQGFAGRVVEWLAFDNTQHQWLLLAACFWVIFMFMVASKFITLAFKDPDVHSAKHELLLLTTMPEAGKLPEETRVPEELKPTGRMLSGSRLAQPLVYMERLELVRNVCRDEALKNLSHTAISKFVLDRIFVCDKHKILFCQTPEVGNTQWKKVLIVLNGAFPSTEEIPENVVHDHEKNGLPRLSSFSDAEIQKREMTALLQLPLTLTLRRRTKTATKTSVSCLERPKHLCPVMQGRFPPRSRTRDAGSGRSRWPMGSGPQTQISFICSSSRASRPMSHPPGACPVLGIYSDYSICDDGFMCQLGQVMVPKCLVKQALA